MITIEILYLMRRWVADCVWQDEDLSDITDKQLLAGIARHYVGGIAQFVQDSK